MLGNAIVIANESGPGRLRGPSGFARRAQPRQRRARSRDVTMKMPLFHELEVQGAANAVDEDDALIQELLVCDLGVHELFESGSRANEFDGFGSAFRAGRKFIQDGKVEELKFQIRRN